MPKTRATSLADWEAETWTHRDIPEAANSLGRTDEQLAMSHVKAQHVDDPVKNKLLSCYLRSSFPEGSCDGSSTREEGNSLSVRLTRSHQKHPIVPGLHLPDHNLRRSWNEDAYMSWLSQPCWRTPSVAGLVTEPGSDAGSLSSGLEVNRSKDQNQAPPRHRPLEGASHLCQTHDCEGKPGDTSGAGLHPRSPNWYKNQGATSGQLLDHTRVNNRSET